MKRKIGLMFLSLVIYTSGGEAAPPVLIPPTTTDPGAQLNRDRETLDRLKVEREIREQKEKADNTIKVDSSKTNVPADKKGTTLFLKDIQFDASQVLSVEELSVIEKKYEGKEITIEQLYEAVNEVNKLYADKGYLVCRAMLLEQSIQDGVVKITLVEGQTGEVFIKNNPSTKKNYITGRLSIDEGKVSNFKKLNKDILWFNGTNNVQLQIEIKAGNKSGTTDYYITAYEPKQHVFNVFVDNSGFENNGEWRGGISYTNRSVFGLRDELSLVGMGSEGTYSGAASYTLPITKKGTRLGVNYSQNRVETIDGPLEDLEIIGKSKSYGVSLTHPLMVSKKMQMEAFVDWKKQKSQTDILGFDWVDDDITNYSGGLALTHYWKDSALYHRHTYSFGSWTNIFDREKDYSRYNFMGLYQKNFKKNQLLTLRMNAQWTPDNYISSSDQFYIGGLYSVRGYEENLLAADKGISASIEYTIPVGKKHQIFGFLDWGHVYGDNAFYDKTLYGTGAGWRWNFMKGGTALVTLGIPLKKNINDQDVDSMQLYFSINKQF